MFEKFTQNALNTFMVASQNASDTIGTEQILLGLLSDGLQSAEILNSFGLNLENTRAEIKKFIGESSRSDKLTPIPFSQSAKKLLDESWNEAKKYNHPVTELHILYALMQTEGNHIQVLKNLGVDIDKVKIEILEQIKNITLKLVYIPTFFEILLGIFLLSFFTFMLWDLITSITLTLSKVIIMIALILISFFVTKSPILCFKFGQTSFVRKTSYPLRMLCMTISVLFICVLIIAFTILIMVTIGKYKYANS